MARSQHTRRIARGACALAASACALLAIAAVAQARPADTGPQPVVHNNPAPTVVKETLLQPPANGPDTITLLLIAVGAAAALLGAGYLGARIALRTSARSRTSATSASTSTPTTRGQASRTGI
jgi:hypothetical protein